MNWRQEYLEKLNVADVTDDELRAIFKLKNNNLPNCLYKYREPNDYAISGLLKDAVWVCSPKRYSDNREFVETINAAEYRDVLNSVLDRETALAPKGKNKLPLDIIETVKKGARRMKVAGWLLPRSLKTKILEVGKRALNDLVIERHRLVIEDIQTKMKVCSFCEVPDSIQMWDDYALHNTGFCIEFNVGQWPISEIRRWLLHPVVYVDDCYNSTRHYIQAANGMFNPFYPIVSGTRKQKKYEYEQEWRFIIQVGASFEEQEYIMNCQSKVFLGNAMDEDYKKRIVDICKQKRLEVYQILPLNGEDKLKFEQVNTTS